MIYYNNIMEPHLNKNDIKLFYKYLNKSNVYFEFGSGGSTYKASLQKNIKKIFSVESDKIWIDKLKKNIINNNITYLYCDINNKPNTWGNPGKNCTDLQKINYSEQIRLISKEDQKNIDLIFIDGRFRVACCLKSFNVIDSNCFIIFDDFLNRKQYHIVLDYFDIIEKTKDNVMVVLKKKENIKEIPTSLIKKYELIKD